MSPLSSFVPGVNPNILNTTVKVVTFTPYERKGVALMAAAGMISCVLVSSLLLYIIISALSPWPKRQPGDPAPFTSKQIAVFVICLLISDLIQSISGITQVKWAIENRIYEGNSCSVQAATLVMGDLGSTVWSSVIAAHTFSGLALGKQWPRWAVQTVVVVGWTFVVILTTVGPTTLAVPSKGPFYSIAGTWCFISSEYAIPRLGIHYIPLFVAAVLILVLYGLVFLVLQGKISFTQPNFRTKGSGLEEFLSRERILVAKRMLWYPVAYLTCILPIAIIRLVLLTGKNAPESVWIFAMVFLFSLGAVDSFIYTTTRRVIKPFSFPSHHMRTFSSEHSDGSRCGGGDIIKRNASYASKPPRFDDLDSPTRRDHKEFADRRHEDADVDVDEDVSFGSASDSSKELHNTMDKNPFRDSKLGAIHVTLERIQEVI